MFIGIDIGGTTTRVVASPSLDDISLKDKRAFNTPKNFEEIITDISNAIEQLSNNKIDAIGIGTTGRINEDKTLITATSKFPDWVNKPIVETLSYKFSCPVYMDNDAVAGAFGVAYFDVEDHKNFLYLTWGTGLGGASVRWDNDKIQVSRLYHPTWMYKWDLLIGGRNIKKRYGKTAEKLSDNEWKTVMDDFESTIISLSHDFNHKLIVVSGGIAVKQREKIVEKAKELKHLNVYISKLGEDAGLYGSFALIKNRDDKL